MKAFSLNKKGYCTSMAYSHKHSHTTGYTRPFSLKSVRFAKSWIRTWIDKTNQRCSRSTRWRDPPPFRVEIGENINGQNLPTSFLCFRKNGQHEEDHGQKTSDYEQDSSANKNVQGSWGNFSKHIVEKLAARRRAASTSQALHWDCTVKGIPQNIFRNSEDKSTTKSDWCGLIQMSQSQSSEYLVVRRARIRWHFSHVASQSQSSFQQHTFPRRSHPKMFLELCRVFFISYTKLVIPHGLRKQEVGFRMKLELLKYGFHLFQAESSRYKNQPFVTIGELRSWEQIKVTAELQID